MRVETKTENCPFCKINNVKCGVIWQDSDGKSYAVNCYECEAQGPIAKTEEEAIKLWNKSKS